MVEREDDELDYQSWCRACHRVTSHVDGACRECAEYPRPAVLSHEIGAEKVNRKAWR